MNVELQAVNPDSDLWELRTKVEMQAAKKGSESNGEPVSVSGSLDLCISRCGDLSACRREWITLRLKTSAVSLFGSEFARGRSAVHSSSSLCGALWERGFRGGGTGGQGQSYRTVQSWGTRARDPRSHPNSAIERRHGRVSLLREPGQAQPWATWLDSVLFHSDSSNGMFSDYVGVTRNSLGHHGHLEDFTFVFNF